MNWNNVSKVFVLIFVIVCVVIFFASCQGFEVKKYSDIKQENLVYNTMALYSDSKDKTVVSKALEYYYKYLHREQCKIEIYGQKTIDYLDYKKLNDYNVCLKELN